MLTKTRDFAAQARTASTINMLLGIWLIASPWIFDYGGRPAVLSSVMAGALIAIVAANRLASLRSTAGLSGVNLLLAVWTIASPWLCEYTANIGAVLDNVILGVVVAALATFSGSATIAAEKQPPVAPVH
jgi:SPW repeat